MHRDFTKSRPQAPVRRGGPDRQGVVRAPWVRVAWRHGPWTPRVRLIPVLLGFTLVTPLWCQIASAQAPAAGAGSGQAGQPRSSGGPGNTADKTKQRQQLEGAIERRARAELNVLVDDFVSRRVDRTDYTLNFDIAVDKQRVASWMDAWNDVEFGVVMAEIQRRPYESLRPLLSQVGIGLGFSEKLSEAETQPVAESLEAYFASQAGSLETVDVTRIPLPPSLPERVARLQVNEARRQVELEAELRMRQIQEEKALELSNAQKLSEAKSRELEGDLEATRRKLGELKDQLLSEDNIKERLVKEAPVLTRLLATGAGIGALVLVSLFVFGFILYFAMRSLGAFMLRGAEGLAEALRDQGVAKETEKKQLEPFGDEHEETKESEEVEEDPLVEFDTKPQLKEAAEQLRHQVMRDTSTTAAVLSKVVEQEKYGEVVAIFDLLGPEIAQEVFAKFTSAAKRLMQRAFFTGQIKRVGASRLFNRINELRTMLATTDVLMRESSDKAFAQVVLSFSDEEIAQAVGTLEKDHATAMLTVLPPDRMFRILRQLKRPRREMILGILGQTVEAGASLSSEAVSQFTAQLLDENKLKTQENIRYLKTVVGIAEDEEYESLTRGLEYNARLLLDVIGVRANIDDLWAQPVEVLEGLFSLLELEHGACVLFTAPESIRNSLLQAYPERKRALTEDALENLRLDEAHRESLQPVHKAARKTLLGRLSEMAEAGSVVLPSRERLLKLAETQEREMATLATEETVVSKGTPEDGSLPQAG